MSHTAAPFRQEVSIVVPTYRRPDILRETLTALLAVDFPKERLQILVIDDGRDDETARVVSDMVSGVVRLEYHRPSGTGAAAARNHGARLARHDLLLFVDDDIILKSDSLCRYQAALARFYPCAVNARWEFSPELLQSLKRTPFGRYRIEVEKWVKTGLGRAPLESGYQEVEGLTACNLALLRDDFWRLGGFDEGFPYAGAEDQELSLRAKVEGLRLVLDDAHEVWHNDRRLTVREFCDRQRRGALSAVSLAAKNPQTHAGRPLITENRPVRRTDPTRVVMKKLAKTVLGLGPLEAVHFRVAAVVESLAPDSQLLRRLYWSLFGVAIFKGVRQGFRGLDSRARRLLDAQ
jgi:GT2 family glycosyltransferase